MVAFYNQGDQNIYKDFQYVPQEKYRLGFTAPVQGGGQDASTPSFGIPATNAFTNSGGGFNQSGNAFGYGSPVSEVNVRTFNPQSNDPTGSVASAQEAYNQLGDIKDKSVYSTYNDINNPIMDNRQNYQANYNSPYDDTVDQSKYTTTIGSFPSQAFFNRMRNKGFNLAENIPYIGLPTKILKSILPEQEDRGPGGGNYGIAGLSDAQKEAYNSLARIEGGGLFQGSGGFKTLTGKNFNLSDKQFDKYMSGQTDIYNKEFAGMSDEEIEDLKNDPRQRNKYRRYQESSAMYKTTEKQKQKQKEEFNKPGGTGEQVKILNKQMQDTGVTGSNYNQAANIAGGGGGNQVINTPAGSMTARDATYDNDPSTGTSQGYSQHYADGGRAGYFFGGRVNFKNGGLASIL